MVYSDDRKFIFLSIPKTGSRSIQDYLQNFGICTKRGWTPNHNNYKQVMKELGKERQEYFKFAFFRNPWSLLISIFFWNRYKHGLPLNKKTVIEWLNAYRGGDSYVSYLFDEEGNIALDFIGKLENINKDLKIVCEKINIPVPEKIFHTGKQNITGRVHYTAYYDIPLKERVQDMFSKSLSVLKYKFGDGLR